MIKTNTILILPENITNKIAAGEVIERPASIIKELLENSIDALSTQITVSIKDSGKSVIKILDNGTGMIRDDALLSLERHATSKISSIDDLSTIETLGFRGEALSSIASISRLNIISKTKDDETGTQIFIEGGKIREVKQLASPTGTSVEVNQIFFNTPARKKFLKSDVTEMSYISQTFNTISLAYPNIQFRLIKYDKEAVNTSASGDMKARIGDLFGKDLVKDLIPISREANKMKLSGYISRPSFSLSGRRNQFFYVNNRCVRDKSVNHAIYDAYRTLLPKGRHPALFLFLDISPAVVDVNVHPAKAEVRFANQRSVHDFIYHAVFKTLSQFKEQHFKDTFQINNTTPGTALDATTSGRQEDTEKFVQSTSINFFTCKDQNSKPSAIPQTERDPDFNLPSPSTQNYHRYSNCVPVGQIENSFIVLENSSNMILVDQHTAHERILFEKLEKEFKESKIERQKLLFPISVELSHSESVLLENHLEEVNKTGMEIECFGKNIFLIREVPSILEGKDYSALLLEIIESLAKAEKTESYEQVFTDTFKILACHGAIRANQKLNHEEIQNLLLTLDKTELPYTCPHGRPISLVFSLKDIKKKFLRI
ncbi:MAG TPA: DNA mismatch repair endonuclease MutL [Nitrospinota bacterium]|jgi:DNA mismatch repair protein MutL|nr:DNA mismatch repair endonuclease MutL [Nitrospinota bacterium]